MSQGPNETTPAPTSPKLQAGNTPRKKLSYKEQRELDQLPTHISQLEAEQSALQAALSDDRIFRNDPGAASLMTARIGLIEEELMTALERWSALSD